MFFGSVFRIALGVVLFTALSADYQPVNFDHLIGHLPGIQDDALKLHFKLYQGYVSNTNYLLKEIAQLEKDGKSRTPYYAGLKRMFGWEFDGMRLHELYFGNLGKSVLDPKSAIAKKIEEEFGGWDKWEESFAATGLIRGIGWAVLYQDPENKKLFNVWINEHDLGHLAGATLLLIMDVWEHAYMTQYGTDRAAYIKAFFENINWDVVSKRYEQVLSQ